jgi:hypothetical protein
MFYTIVIDLITSKMKCGERLYKIVRDW